MSACQTTAAQRRDVRRLTRAPLVLMGRGDLRWSLASRTGSRNDFTAAPCIAALQARLGFQQGGPRAAPSASRLREAASGVRLRGLVSSMFSSNTSRAQLLIGRSARPREEGRPLEPSEVDARPRSCPGACPVRLCRGGSFADDAGVATALGACSSATIPFFDGVPRRASRRCLHVDDNLVSAHWDSAWIWMKTLRDGATAVPGGCGLGTPRPGAEGRTRGKRRARGRRGYGAGRRRSR